MFLEDRMESSDSQLSDLTKNNKLNVDSRGIERKLTQDLSQNTIQRIMDNVTQDSLIMSQGTFNVTDLKATPGSGHNENEQNDDGFFQFSPSSESDQLFGQKKTAKTRTPRITDSPSESIFNAYNLNTSGVLYYDPKDSALLNESIVSNTTLSQIPLGSQSCDYLRQRTEEEQELRNKKRLAQKLLEKEEQEKRKREANQLAEQMTQQMEPIIFDNDMDDSFINLDEPIKTERPFMSVTVNVKNTDRVSDLAFEDTSDGKHLWTKMNCKVPIEVKWIIDPRYRSRELFLRIRFVSYASHEQIQDAIRNPNSDVIKCATHTDENCRSPRQSFFDVVDTDLDWFSDRTLMDRGHSFVTKLEPGATQISFDIKFMCQKNCMTIIEKRKSQCFAAFLEDENGNEIVCDQIEKVSIVGYPRRDWKAFCEKRSDFTFSENSSFRQPSISPSGNRKQLSPGMNQSQQTSTNAMLNVTNTPKMYTPKSASRKRAASEFSPLVNAASSSSKSASYAVRIHGCEPQLEDMDYENGMLDIPASATTKRIKTVHYPHKNITLSDDEYKIVVQLLAERGKEELSKLGSSRFVGSFSTPMSRIKPTDGIDKFLAVIGERKETERFCNLGVQRMSDLSRMFEEQSNVFERLGIDFSKLKKYYDTFLHYYRIQKSNEMFPHD